jgi:hypothetical protein
VAIRFRVRTLAVASGASANDTPQSMADYTLLALSLAQMEETPMTSPRTPIQPPIPRPEQHQTFWVRAGRFIAHGWEKMTELTKVTLVACATVVLTIMAINRRLFRLWLIGLVLWVAFSIHTPALYEIGGLLGQGARAQSLPPGTIEKGAVASNNLLLCLIKQRAALDDGKISVEALAVAIYEACYLERRELDKAFSGNAKKTLRLAPKEDDLELQLARSIVIGQRRNAPFVAPPAEPDLAPTTPVPMSPGQLRF